MKVCLIANVGKRDLQIDGTPLLGNGEADLRAKSTAIAGNYDAVKDRLSAPMIQPAIERIHRLEGQRLAAVVLVATDQKDERFRPGDTIGCAEVLKRFLFDVLSRNRAPEKKVLEQEPSLVRITDAPHRYDRMAEYYQRSVVTVKALRDADRVYLLCAGGTPACNTALLMEGVAQFREKCHVLNVDEGTGTVRPLDMGRRMLDGFRREARDRLLERGDFDAIAHDPGYREALRLLAEAAEARLNFAFQRHERLVANLVHTEAGRHRAFDTIQDDAQRLVSLSDESTRLIELYWNAWLKWRRNECADFLGRVWRLCEAALCRGVGLVSGLTFDGSRESDKAFSDWGSGQAGLVEWLKKQMRRPDIALKPNTEVLQHTLTYLLLPGNSSRFSSAEAELGEVANQVEALYKARNLRNKSIVAHGYNGLSKRAILEALEMDEKELFASLGKLLEAQGVAIADNPYDRYVEMIRALDKDGG